MRNGHAVIANRIQKSTQVTNSTLILPSLDIKNWNWSFSRQTDSLPTLSRPANTQPSYLNAAAEEAHFRSVIFFDQSNSQGKKDSAVEPYLRDKKFSGAPEHWANNLIRGIETCATQHMLEPSQLSLFFVYALADPAGQFFWAACSSRMTFDQIGASMKRHYNSESRKLQLQSEMDSLDLSACITRHEVILRYSNQDCETH